MTPHQFMILIQIQPRLRRAILARFGSAQIDDLVQAANLAIIERADNDPTYLVARPAHIIRMAVWRAHDHLRRDNAYVQSVVSFDDTEQCTKQDFVLIIDVERALSGVGDRTRFVAFGLAGGMKGSEIAAALDISPQAITYHKRILREVLERVRK